MTPIHLRGRGWTESRRHLVYHILMCHIMTSFGMLSSWRLMTFYDVTELEMTYQLSSGSINCLINEPYFVCSWKNIRETSQITLDIFTIDERIHIRSIAHFVDWAAGGERHRELEKRNVVFRFHDVIIQSYYVIDPKKYDATDEFILC